MVWIIGEEPKKYQFHYCLGFFNWKIKGDLQQALNDFKEFLKVDQDNNFMKEKELAAEWSSGINKQLGEQAN